MESEAVRTYHPGSSTVRTGVRQVSQSTFSAGVQYAPVPAVLPRRRTSSSHDTSRSGPASMNGGWVTYTVTSSLAVHPSLSVTKTVKVWVKLGNTAVVPLPAETTSSAGCHWNVELGSLPAADTSKAWPRHTPPSSLAYASGTRTSTVISSVPMPHTLAMATLKVVVSSGEAYGNCKLASFTNSAGLHSHWSPSAPGN